MAADIGYSALKMSLDLDHSSSWLDCSDVHLRLSTGLMESLPFYKLTSGVVLTPNSGQTIVTHHKNNALISFTTALASIKIS